MLYYQLLLFFYTISSLYFSLTLSTAEIFRSSIFLLRFVYEFTSMLLIWQLIQIRISPKRGNCTWNSSLYAKCRTERRFHAIKFSDGYKPTMDWCSVYSTPQSLPKYIYFSPPLIFLTTYNGIRTKTPLGVNHFRMLHYVKWDRIVTLTGAQADWGLRYRI